MISETTIQFETLEQNPSLISGARLAHEAYWLGKNPDRTCYWCTSDGEIVMDRFRPDQAKLALLTYLNRGFIV